MFKPYIESQKTIKRWTAVVLLFLVLSLFSSTIGAIAKKEAVAVTMDTLSADSSGSTPDPVPNPILDYSIDIHAQSSTVVEVGRGMRLYMKNSDEQLNIPVASKIMTALLAIEKIPLDTKITISKVAADQPDSDALSLVNGEKYTLDYLLYGLLLMDNNAAAIAIAEQISGEEAGFITLMNEKAVSYKMENTVFTNVTGLSDGVQHSTVSDVARLVRYALTFTTFETIMKTKDIPFFLSTDKVTHIFSNIQNAWSLVETTTGALRSDSDTESSFVTTSSFGGINIITVASTTKPDRIISDIETLSDSIFSDYEYSTLVMENQSFPKTITVGTDVITLRFNQDITYIHPKNNNFIASTTYEENEIIEYPVLETNAVAKVTFELLDGTKISVDLYPSASLWGEANFMQQLVLLYNANPDIGLLILIALGLLFIVCIYNIVHLFVYLNQLSLRKIQRVRQQGSKSGQSASRRPDDSADGDYADADEDYGNE